MRESPGKNIARQLFYLHCLPKWFSEIELKSGNFLLLVGEEPRELLLLDQLWVARQRIWSVEHKLEIYRQQHDSNWGISLFYGEMKKFLDYLLHTNQNLMVLNLDIEGSYLVHLDPAMTSVLLFCWRNPTTVVGTYSSIGRDTEMIWEGILSYAFFYWLLPQETEELIGDLAIRYEQAGFSQPVRMALRDMFWLYSNFKHALLASVAARKLSARAVSTFLGNRAKIWQMIIPISRTNLRIKNIRAILSQNNLEQSISPSPRIYLDDIFHLSYNAQLPWSERCYYSKYQPSLSKNETLQAWLGNFFQSFRRAPLIHIDRQGKQQKIAPVNQSISGQTILWPDKKIFTQFRPQKQIILPCWVNQSIFDSRRKRR